MRAKEFEPSDLRVAGRLAWMKDADEGHWFSVPSSNEQLIFREDGIYAHSLTGFQIDVMEVHALYGSPQIVQWSGSYPCRDNALFSELLEWGEEIYRALLDSGFEFWSGDETVLLGWSKFKTVLRSDGGFSVISRSELKGLLNACIQREKARWAEPNPHTQRQDCRRAKRLKLHRDRDSWRVVPQYEQVFAEVYGKPQSAIAETDPKSVIYHAHCVVEYRLKLGIWADQVRDSA